MANVNRVFEALRTCISNGKCSNKKCPYIVKCDIAVAQNAEQYVRIPMVLALDVINEMRDLILYKEEDEA